MAATTSQLSVNIASLNSKTLFNLLTIDDEIYETDGVVAATILASPHYDVTPSYQTATVAILDNDHPAISINGTGTILEGENAEFELLSTLAPLTNLRINLAVSAVGEFLTASTITHTIFATNSTNSLLTIPTLDDDEDEYHGTIQVEILPGIGYKVAVGDTSSASIVINDNDDPIISIGAENFLVDEGESVVFRLESSTPPENSLPISIILNQVEEYLITDSATISYYNDANNPNEELGLSTQVYNFENKTSDNPSLSTQVYNSQDKNDELLETPIESLSTDFIDGTSIEDKNSAINLDSNTKNTSNSITIDFPANQSIALLSLSTQLYKFDGANGEVSASIENGDNYEVNQFSDSATVTVVDIDTPIISLAYSGPDEINEGAVIDLTASSSLLSIHELSINYRMSQTGAFIEDSN